MGAQHRLSALWANLGVFLHPVLGSRPRAALHHKRQSTGEALGWSPVPGTRSPRGRAPGAHLATVATSEGKNFELTALFREAPSTSVGIFAKLCLGVSYRKLVPERGCR